MASPSGKGVRAPEAPGCRPQPLTRGLVDSMDDEEGLYMAVERCPLCNTTRQQLTCTKCVQRGDLVYSDRHDRERFIDKERLSQLKSKPEEFHKNVRDFPGGAVVRTPLSQCRGPRSTPGQGTRYHVHASTKGSHATTKEPVSRN